MKLRTKFILFIVVLHLIMLGASYFIFRQNKIVFIVSEIFLLVSIALALQLYKELIRPLQLLSQGAEAIRDKDFNVKFALTGSYEMDELIQVYNQMADALRTERTRQEQQHLFLSRMIETSPTGILILDYDERVHDINPRALRLMNLTREQVVGLSVDGSLHPLMHQLAVLRSGEARTVTINGVNTYKLQKSHFIDRGFARHFVMIEELTAEILAAEKKAYGKVIRMMTHEVNNTIGPVNSILQTALDSERLWAAGSNQSLRNALQVAFDRNTSLTIFMKNFTDVVRLPEPNRRNIDLHGLLRRTGHFMEMSVVGKRIEFRYEFDPEPFVISADGQQMEQVIINVVKNSIEAIDAEGIITYRTDNARRELVIEDTGRGIGQAIAGELFSPFFSTKPDGQGIGLTLVKEILINHGFGFSLQQADAGHTRFVFHFGTSPAAQPVPLPG